MNDSDENFYKCGTPMSKRHNERCKECKTRVFQLLCGLFGEVKREHNLGISSGLDSFEHSTNYAHLSNILHMLQEYRGYNNFVRRRRMTNVDFFVPAHGLIVEFDESQHFTKPRQIALDNYPADLKLGFNRKQWVERCVHLHKTDNDPPYRDETRAWYDTLKDFAPSILDLKPTVRLYSKDCVWCELDLGNSGNIAEFKRRLGV